MRATNLRKVGTVNRRHAKRFPEIRLFFLINISLLNDLLKEIQYVSFSLRLLFSDLLPLVTVPRFHS